VQHHQPGEITQDKDAKRKRLLGVGLWGAATTVVAYLLAFGSLVLFVANIFAIGILLRAAAWAVMRRRGKRPPRWWWL
jgi:hypothetical protein